MKAYKASYNGKCQSITYEVGKTYTFNGHIEMCSSGFHFCLNPKDLLDYYPYRKDLVIFEIEVKNGNYMTDCDKSVTNSFKVIRKVNKSEYKKLLDIKLDSKDNMIRGKDYYGLKCNYKYDSKGNLIWQKDSTGYEQKHKYDSKGNLIWQKDSKGNEWSIEIK